MKATRKAGTGTGLAHKLVREGNVAEVKKKVVKKEVFGTDELGQTPLHIACLELEPKREIIEHLISKKAEVNAPDNNGWTSLHCLCSASADCAMIRYLRMLKKRKRKKKGKGHFFLKITF